MYHWTVCFTTRHKSHFQTVKMQKMSSHEASAPWTVGFANRHKSHSQAAKMQKMNSKQPGFPELWFSRLGKSRFFRPPKCRKYAHKKLGPLELWVSRLGKSCIPTNATTPLHRCHAPSYRAVALLILSILSPRISLLVASALTLWRRNFLLNFSTLCI